MVQSARLSVLVGIITMGVTAMRTDINSIGRDQLMQAAANASTACQGFAGVNAAIREVGAANALGQSRTEAAILTIGYQGQLAAKDNTFEIVFRRKIAAVLRSA